MTSGTLRTALSKASSPALALPIERDVHEHTFTGKPALCWSISAV